jgi:hypothetical protein
MLVGLPSRFLNPSPSTWPTTSPTWTRVRGAEPIEPGTHVLFELNPPRNLELAFTA